MWWPYFSSAFVHFVGPPEDPADYEPHEERYNGRENIIRNDGRNRVLDDFGFVSTHS